jgi:multiple sugar transport system permease protein
MQTIDTRSARSAAGVVARVRPAKRSSKDWRSMLWALLFLGPNLVLFLMFMAYPVAYGFYLSFFQYSVVAPAEWVGIQNYTSFFQDPFTSVLVKNSLYYAVGAIIPSLVLPLFVAVLLNNAGGLKKLWRGLYFLPLVTSPVAAAAVWKWMYAKDFGLINYGLRSFGGTPVDWLFNLDWAMPAIIIMTVWLLMPINVIFYTAGLQEIPRDYYDAASLDGASAWQQFRHITVPLITPTTFFVLLTTMIGVLFGGFDVINVMTQGGPLNATNILIYDIYQNAFQYFRMGYASAQAYILFVFVFLLTVVNWLLQKRWVHYS